MAANLPTSVRRALRGSLALSIAGTATLLTLAAVIGSSGETRVLMLLTCVGFSIGAILADLHVGAWTEFRKSAVIGLVAIGISQLCYLLLLWTGWRPESLLWRLYWLTMVGSIASSHLLVLRFISVGRRDWIERATPICALMTMIMIMGFALQRNLPPRPGVLYLWCGAVPGACALLGTLIAWRRRARERSRHGPMSRRVTLGWLAASHVVLLCLGYYLGRASVPEPERFELLPSALANVSPSALETQLQADVALLETVATGMIDDARRATKLETALRARLAADERTYYLPTEDDDIRAVFLSYLSRRSELLRIWATYSGFEAVPDLQARARCFMIGFAAALTNFRTSIRLITTFRDQPIARRKLNEPGGIPAGMFDKIYESVASERNMRFCAEMAAYYELKRSDWQRKGVWPKEQFERLDAGIRSDLQYIEENRVDDDMAWLDLFVERVRHDAYTPVYAAQSLVLEWLGDTRVIQRPPFITIDQIQAIEPRLQPGDILLERRNWYISNALLPGFWPHAALYVGRMDDLRRLGIAEHPSIRAHRDNYLKRAPDGEDHTVIEAVSEGVIFNSLTESMHADYIAVLRPRLTRPQIAQAIVRAFENIGKPYDFDFDFGTADKLVCTELIYRAYEGMLQFKLIRVTGRDTVPAVELVRKFAAARFDPDRELDFVLFLDAVPEKRVARHADVNEFCASADRPPAFTE